MKRTNLLIAVLTAFLILPATLFGSPDQGKGKQKGKEKHAEKAEKSVPAPPALVLVGVAGAVAGLYRMRGRRRKFQ